MFQSSSRYGGASSSSSEASLSHQLQQLRRDLKESLERETDLREQLKFTEEEARVMRRKLRHAAAGLINADDVDVASDDEDGDQQGVDAKSTTSGKTSSDRQATTSSTSADDKDKDKDDSELRMQLDSAEHEVCRRSVRDGSGTRAGTRSK